MIASTTWISNRGCRPRGGGEEGECWGQAVLGTGRLRLPQPRDIEHLLDSVQRTPTVVALVQAAHDESRLPSGELDPERLAVLSDAVEGAGGDDVTILDHLRSPESHFRGCWAPGSYPTGLT